MPKSKIKVMLMLCCLVLVGFQAQAQSMNLLQNPDASDTAMHWQLFGDATIESRIGGDLCFVVRNGGHFYQDVQLPSGAEGQYAVLIGRGSSERINPDGAITGLPCLYGYMTNSHGKILSYLQGQRMLGSTRVKDEWGDLWGVFQVPEGTRSIKFFLNQASRAGVPQNGSAARFDKLGLYIFPTKDEAQAFVNEYH